MILIVWCTFAPPQAILEDDAIILLSGGDCENLLDLRVRGNNAQFLVADLSVVAKNT